MSFVGVGLLAVVLLVGGCRSTDAAAPADGDASVKTESKRVPLTPNIDWSKLNALQKCTAAIGIVPGYLIGAAYNTYFWVTGQ